MTVLARQFRYSPLLLFTVINCHELGQAVLSYRRCNSLIKRDESDVMVTRVKVMHVKHMTAVDKNRKKE